MSWYAKVAWQEGLFFRPQLFQQQERYFEKYAHMRAAPLELHPKSWTRSNLWGVFHDEVRRTFP
ncbi:hypothetical protein C6Q28_22705, partial [Burkholderia multivorans]|uniref:hypothetical protein n=1 Tax=Burkholderia multivorans TaxID=87883 RepID=UPI000D48BCA7